MDWQFLKFTLQNYLVKNTSVKNCSCKNITLHFRSMKNSQALQTKDASLISIGRVAGKVDGIWINAQNTLALTFLILFFMVLES